jgi:hypothetical protein
MCRLRLIGAYAPVGGSEVKELLVPSHFKWVNPPPLMGVSRSFPSFDGSSFLSFPSLDGRGLRGGCNKQFIRTASLSACNAQAGKTLCVLVNTSLFQNLRTLNPWLLSHSSLSVSFFVSTACCPPSTSMIRRFYPSFSDTLS